MTELLAAMDVSGNLEQGNYAYMGMVIGTRDHIEAMIRNMGIDRMSARSLKQTETRKELASGLYFDHKESIAFCIKLDRHDIISSIKMKNTKKHPNRLRARIISQYNRLLLEHMHDHLFLFIRKHNYELDEICFECDADCREFAKDAGLKYTDNNLVHVISDLVAWSNNKGNEPHGVIPLNPTTEISRQLYHNLRKG